MAVAVLLRSALFWTPSSLLTEVVVSEVVTAPQLFGEIMVVVSGLVIPLLLMVVLLPLSLSSELFPETPLLSVFQLPLLLLPAPFAFLPSAVEDSLLRLAKPELEPLAVPFCAVLEPLAVPPCAVLEPDPAGVADAELDTVLDRGELAGMSSCTFGECKNAEKGLGRSSWYPFADLYLKAFSKSSMLTADRTFLRLDTTSRTLLPTWKMMRRKLNNEYVKFLTHKRWTTDKYNRFEL